MSVSTFKAVVSLFLSFILVNPNEWLEIENETSVTRLTKTGLNLHQGGLYSLRIGAVNYAGIMAAFETNGVLVDITPPDVSLLQEAILIIDNFYVF
jgi:hypothetical protein